MITSPTGRIYVGSTIQKIEDRWEDYIYLTCKQQTKLYNFLLKHTVENHIFELVWQGDVNDMLKYEAMIGTYYEVLDPVIGLNCKLPKINDVYQCVSQETKDKISNSHKGKKMPEVTRLAINKANTGRKRPYKPLNLSPEALQKKSKFMKENWHKIHRKNTITESGREILRELASKRIHTEEENMKISDKNSIPIVQLDLQGIFIKEWKSARQVYNTLGWSYSNIQSVCAGKRKKANGFQWKYKKDYEANT